MSVSQRISVLITSYNYRQFIAEAVDSALAQSRPPDEILIIDDGSTDDTAGFLRERYANQPNVRLHSRENRGQLASFGEGARLASGDILALLDADDRWLPDYLARVLAVYQQQPEVDFIYTNMRYFGARQGLFLSDPDSRRLGLSVLLGAYSTRWQGSATSAMSLRRVLALEVLEIPEPYLGRWRTRADDWLVCGSDILRGHKNHLAEPLVEYRAHGNNAWLDQGRDPGASLRHWLKVESMLAYYRARAGLPPEVRADVLRHAKYEFLTRPQPSYKELRAYCRLIDGSSLPWSKRLERKFSMWRHYLRSR